MTQAITGTQDLSPKALKIRLKQACPNSAGAMFNFYLRVHRAISWLQQADDSPADMIDAKFMFLWISLNSLYACWDVQANGPAHDHASRVAFLNRLCNRDGIPLLLPLLRQRRPLIKRIFENPYLSTMYWRNPTDPKALGRGAQDANHLDHLLRDGDAHEILERVFERLAVLRGQIVHGAATSRSRLNRGTLTTSAQLLQGLMPLLVRHVIDRHCDSTWPDVCYPPQGAIALAPLAGFSSSQNSSEKKRSGTGVRA